MNNDRYKADIKGKTRKSASSAKPKREAGVSTSAVPAKAAAKGVQRRWWQAGGGARQPLPSAPSTPEMKKLRRIWWGLMVAAVLTALAMVPASGMKNRALDYALIAFYVIVLGSALYLEFGPLRKARQAAVASAKKGAKSGGKGTGKTVGGKGGARA